MLPPAILLFLGSIWGLSFSVAKVATDGGVPPIGYSFWQALGAGTILLILCCCLGTPPRLGRREIVYYLTAGLLGLALPNAILIITIAHVPAGIAGVIINTVPLITYGLAVAFAMEAFGWRRATGIFCGFAGALLLILPKASLPAPEMAAWVAFGFLSPACYAAANIYNARFRPAGVGSLSLACGMMLGAAVWLAPAMALTGSFHPIWPPLAAAEWAILGQILISCLAYILFFELLRLAGVVYLSQVAYIVALTALAWGSLLFGERHSLWVWAAVALILSGIALVNWRAARPRG